MNSYIKELCGALKTAMNQLGCEAPSRQEIIQMIFEEDDDHDREDQRPGDDPGQTN